MKPGRMRHLTALRLLLCWFAVQLFIIPGYAAAAPAALPTDAELARMSDEQLVDLLARLNLALAPAIPVSIAGIGSGLGGGKGGTLTLAHVVGLDVDESSSGATSAGFSAGFGDVSGWNVSVGLGATLRGTEEPPRGTLSLRIQRPLEGIPGGMSVGVSFAVNAVRDTGLTTGASSASVALSIRRSNQSGATLRSATMATIGARLAERKPSPDIFGGFGLGLQQKMGASLAFDGVGTVAGLHLWTGRNGATQISATIREVHGQRTLGIGLSRTLGH